jgi:hypothetical protein
MTRVVVPAIGLFAVTGALALVALAPVVLFSSSNEAGPLPSAPAASSEVASVTAARFRPQPPASQATANATPKAPGETSAGGQLVAISPVGGVEGDTAGEAARRPAAREAGPAVEEPAQPGHPGNAKGKGKDKVGKAKGHAKPNPHGKAKGHAKWQGRTAVAFAPSGAKPGHVSPSRAGKHSGRSARPHSRSRR